MMPAQIFTRPIEEDALPEAPGAYGLLIRLPQRLQPKIGVLGSLDLAAGDYLYFGSAYGPGGLRARLRRHLRPSKKIHWHVDRLTIEGTVSDILAVPEGSECDLVERALPVAGVSVPVPGFGSSDCRSCSSHLLYAAGDGRSVLSGLAI